VFSDKGVLVIRRDLIVASRRNLKAVQVYKAWFLDLRSGSRDLEQVERWKGRGIQTPLFSFLASPGITPPEDECLVLKAQPPARNLVKSPSAFTDLKPKTRVESRE
jgi:hypothetical protein